MSNGYPFQVDENNQVRVNPKFLDSMVRKTSIPARIEARWQRIGYYTKVLDTPDLKGRKSELNSILILPALYVRNNDFKMAEKLLNDLNYLARAVRLGALPSLIDLSEVLCFRTETVAKLKSLLSKPFLTEENTIAQSALEQNFEIAISHAEKFETSLLLNPSKSADSLPLFSTKTMKTVKTIGTGKYLLVDEDGFVFKSNLKDMFERVKFNYRDINSISIGTDRILICSSYCSSIYSTDMGKIADLRNNFGPIVASVASDSGSHFATIHHEKRGLQVWRGKDGKELWNVSLSHVPS